jgi:predicted nuclease with TOPRIM domain
VTVLMHQPTQCVEGWARTWTRRWDGEDKSVECLEHSLVKKLHRRTLQEESQDLEAPLGDPLPTLGGSAADKQL